MFKNLTHKEIAAILMELIRTNESMYQVRRSFEILLRDSKKPKYRFKNDFWQGWFYYRVNFNITQAQAEILLSDCLTTEPIDDNILLHTKQEPLFTFQAAS